MKDAFCKVVGEKLPGGTPRTGTVGGGRFMPGGGLLKSIGGPVVGVPTPGGPETLLGAPMTVRTTG